MVAPDRLVILHAPGHAPDVTAAKVKKAKATGADSAALSEAYREAGNLDSEDYAAVVGSSAVDTRMVQSPRGDAGDNPILVRRDHKIIRERAYKVTDPGKPEKYAPERHVYVVDYKWAGRKICHISAHPNPLFCGREGWQKVMDKVVREVEKARDRGCLPIVTGDLQTVQLAVTELKRAGLTVARKHIDFIGYDPALRLVDMAEIDGGMDHPWLCATFVAQ